MCFKKLATPKQTKTPSNFLLLSSFDFHQYFSSKVRDVQTFNSFEPKPQPRTKRWNHNVVERALKTNRYKHLNNDNSLLSSIGVTSE